MDTITEAYATLVEQAWTAAENGQHYMAAAYLRAAAKKLGIDDIL